MEIVENAPVVDLTTVQSPPPSTAPPVAVEARGIGGLLRGVPGRQGHRPRLCGQQDHGPDRSIRLWQEHRAPRLQPHERSDSRGPGRGRGPLRRRRHLRAGIDPVEVRRRVGMVFQKPNPFPKSIYDNVAWGAKVNGFKGKMDDLVEGALRQAALWDEVKDKLKRERLLALRRPAAEALHRPGDRRQARRSS